MGYTGYTYQIGGWYVERRRFVLSAYVVGKINTVDLHDLFYQTF